MNCCKTIRLFGRKYFYVLTHIHIIPGSSRHHSLGVFESTETAQGKFPTTDIYSFIHRRSKSPTRRCHASVGTTRSVTVCPTDIGSRPWWARKPGVDVIVLR